MSLLSAFGLGVLFASTFIVWLGDIHMLIGCVVGAGAVITDIFNSCVTEE